jgi:hypothetical protein
VSESAKLSGPTSAHALHSVLQAVKEANTSTLAQAWSKVLDAELRSLKFAERHGEVVGLWCETLSQIGSLPSERTRARLRSYAVSWWSALIVPDSSWSNTNTSPANVITDSDLDHLANTGDIISSQLTGTAIAPDTADLAALRSQCEEWVSILADRTEIAEDPIRLTLLGQMNHLLWLIDNVGLFGVSRVVERGDQAAGALARTALSKPNVVSKLNDFKRRSGRLVMALAILTGLLTGVGATIEAANTDLLYAQQLEQDVARSVTMARPSEAEPSPADTPDEHDAASGDRPFG